MLSLVFAVSAGIFALGTAFAAPAYKDTAVTSHPFGEAAGMPYAWRLSENADRVGLLVV